MKHILTSIAILFSMLLSVQADQRTESILRVASTLQEHNIGQPWEKKSPYRRRGLGVVIGKNLVLTTAEMAANATFIELETPNGEHKMPAKTVCIDYESNLALLSAKEEEGIKIIESLKRVTVAKPAKLKDTVTMLQVEDNGMPLITDGKIRGADTISSFARGHYFLSYEVKTSLQSSANSFTIPIFKGNELLGLLTSYDSDDQLADMIAPEIIAAFLEDAKDGKYVGFPSLGISTNRTTDEHFRAWLKLNKKQGGLFVSKIDRNSSAQKAGIKVGDVLLKVGKHSIDNRGYYDAGDYGQLYWSHLTRGMNKVGDTIKITVLREGKEKVIDVKLERPAEGIIPSHTYGKAPRYLIKGGFIFQELTKSYLELFGSSWETRAPLSLLDAYNHPEDYEKGRNRLVFLSRTIPTDATVGYEKLRASIVLKVNGKKIADIPSLIKAFETPEKDGIHSIELDDEPKKIYLDAAEARKVENMFIQRGLPSLYREKE